jgi:endonuclease/exonuclease/phosphatase family metal-dependent hydrolase
MTFVASKLITITDLGRPGRSLRMRALTSWAITVALAAGLGCGEESPPPGPPVPLRVHVRNLYLGADFGGLAGLLSPADIPPRAADIWADVRMSNPPERMQLVAGQILAGAPDVVALQEVTLYRRQVPSDWTSGAPSNATEVVYDFLDLLLAAMEAQGGHYVAVAVQENGDAEVPTLADDGTSLFDLRLTDRNVVLVRQGLTASAAPGGIFSDEATLKVPVGGAGGTTLRLERGWTAADVTLEGKSVRVVSAHLEVGGVFASIQEAQARELLTALNGRRDRLVLAGDFNSRADNSTTASYRLLTMDGTTAPFKDAWTAGSGDGFTCCVSLYDPSEVAEGRIDMVLFRGDITARTATVIGTDPGMLTTSGLRGSDHFGVEALLDVR